MLPAPPLRQNRLQMLSCQRPRSSRCGESPRPRNDENRRPVPPAGHVILAAASECPAERSYGVRPVNGAGLLAIAVCGGGSAGRAHRLCVRNEERCRSLVSSVAGHGCSQRSLGSLLASLRRCALLAEPLGAAATASSRVPSSGRRARGRPRPRRSCGACLSLRARASVCEVVERCARLALARREVCRRVCVRA